jgi:hypothetical protein
MDRRQTRRVASVMSKRFWIVSLSIAAHAAVFTIAFVTNAWRLDRLDTQRSSLNLAVMLPPPAPSGGPEPGHKPTDPVKPPPKQVASDLTQPVVVEKRPAAPLVADTGGGGIGDSHGPGGEPTDTGTCTCPACGPPALEKVPDPPKVVIERPIIVAPPALKAQRISGETLISPPDIVKTQMQRDDHKKSIGTFKLCVDTAGAVSSVTTLASTKYPAYDAKLMTAIRAWGYKPFMVGDKPVAVCSTVSFVYVME